MYQIKNSSIFGAIFVSTWLFSGLAVSAAEVRFETSAQTPVFADYFEGFDNRPTVLLFHMAGSDARKEYATIIPRLSEQGMTVLAVDTRSGGSRLGGANRTSEVHEKPPDSYCDDMTDLRAALKFVLEQKPERQVFLWGSSFSAGLVFHLAHENRGKVAGIIAFSPASGEAMDGCQPEDVAGSLDIPVLVIRPKSEIEAAPWISEQAAFFEQSGARVIIREKASHGSLALDPERSGTDTEDLWQAILAFLESP